MSLTRSPIPSKDDTTAVGSRDIQAELREVSELSPIKSVLLAAVDYRDGGRKRTRPGNVMRCDERRVQADRKQIPFRDRNYEITHKHPQVQRSESAVPAGSTGGTIPMASRDRGKLVALYSMDKYSEVEYKEEGVHQVHKAHVNSSNQPSTVTCRIDKEEQS